VARQRIAREWINFAEIADWCAREPGSIVPDETRRAATYSRLRTSIMSGEFQQGDRARTLFLSPDTSMAKLTAERLKVIMRLFDDAVIVSAYLPYCWVPRELCRQWFKRQRLAWPDHFYPDSGKQNTGGLVDSLGTPFSSSSRRGPKSVQHPMREALSRLIADGREFRTQKEAYLAVLMACQVSVSKPPRGWSDQTFRRACFAAGDR
jgi:hypothetical protein